MNHNTLMRKLAKGLRLLFAAALVAGLASSVEAAQTPPPPELAQGAQPLGQVRVLNMPPLDNRGLLNRDRTRPTTGVPLRFAEPLEVEVTPSTHGTWETLKDGSRLWRLRVSSDDALSLNLGFTRYVMPPGGRLFVYSADYSTVIGPFSEADNEVHGQLWTPLVPSDEIVIEVSLPAAVESQLELSLTQVNHGYRGFDLLGDKIDGDTSGSCNVDVVCPQGDDWPDEIRSVGAYTLNGDDQCSGALVNNTAQDTTPYFLTADHCDVDAGNAPSVVVYWNFENSTCRLPGSAESGQPGDGQLNQFNTGAIFRADHAPSDMTLLELDDPINAAFNVHWAGWDRTNADPISATAIHHPAVAEKRISLENDPTTTTSYFETAVPGDGTHIRVEDWDLGTTEIGSSGSPLFNQDHRIVGQLHGGNAACGNDESDWYGRLSVSWVGGGTSATRLRDWLDPSNTGATVLDGMNFSFVVNTTSDTTDAMPGDGYCADANSDCSLRAAIEEANAKPDRDRIRLPNLGPDYMLTRNQPLVITQGVTIQGDGAPFISGNSSAIRVLEINARNVEVVGVQIGFSEDSGIFVAQGAELLLTRAVVEGNFGNGIVNAGGLLVRQTLIHLNAPSGINTEAGSLTLLINTTISGNGDPTETTSGGGVFNSGTLRIFNSTISANRASSSGGGIHNTDQGSVEFHNTIIAGNTVSAGGTGADCSGSLGSNGYNLVGSDTGCPTTGNNDQTVAPDAVFTTVLGLLTTDFDYPNAPATHPLLDIPENPAIDGGKPDVIGPDGEVFTTCPPTDQRGVARPMDGDGDDDDIAVCDIGAYEAPEKPNDPMSLVTHANNRLNPVLWSGKTRPLDYRVASVPFEGAAGEPADGELDAFGSAEQASTEGVLDVEAGGPIYWLGNTLGRDQQAFISLVELDPNGQHHSVLLKVQPNKDGLPRWQRGAIAVFYNTIDGNKVGVETYVPGRGWHTLATFPMTLRDGDQLGGRALANGTVQAFVNGIAIFDQPISAGPFFANKAGRAGLWFSVTADTLLDDFSAATAAP